MIFPLPAGNSRRRRRLKKPGALAPGFTGVWGRSATNKHASVYTEALLATMVKAPKVREASALFSISYLSYNGRELD